MKNLIVLSALLIGTSATAQITKELEEVTITSIQRNKVNTGSLLDSIDNYGQSPDRVIERLPGIYAYGDNGTSFGYSYFRMRGMDQGRINVSLDGIPWNEAEDFGCYFSNCPDLMASMKNIKVERGASITMNGVAAYAGNVSLESIDLRNAKTGGSIEIGAGTLGSYRLSGSYISKLGSGWSVYVRGTTLGTDGYREHAYNNSKSFSFKVSKEWEGHTLDFFSITGKHNNGQGYQGVLWNELPKHNTPFKQVSNGCTPQETDNFINTYNRLQYRGYLSSTLSLVSTLYWTAQKGDYRIGGKEYGWLNNYHLLYHTLGGNVMARWSPTNDIRVEGGVNAYYYRRDHTGYDLPSDTVIQNFRDKGFPVLYQNYGVKPDYSIFVKAAWKGLEGSIQFRETFLSYHVKKKSGEGDRGNKHNWNIVNASLGYIQPVGPDQAYIRWSMVGKEPSRTDLFGGEYFTGEYTLKDPGAIERVNDVEIGYEVRRGSVKANLNFYYMGFSNELVATGELSPTNGLPLHTQQDGYRLGVEGSVIWKVLPSLTFTENAGWSRNRLSNFKSHPYSPSITSFTEVAWRIGKVEIALNALYHSKVWLDLKNTASLPNTFSLSATLDWKISKRVGWNLHLQNITNKRNLTAGSLGEGGQVYYIIDAPFTAFTGLTITL